MSVIDDLRSLDSNDPGRWPLPFRVAAVVLVLVAVAALGIWQFVVKTELPELERAEQQERELFNSFRDKQQLAANFEAYSNQLAEIERDFGMMLRQLPGRTEIESLLVDISQTALGAGLEEKTFTPQAEIPRDFYAEKPITLRYTGSYHEIGEFVSNVAALPRIVTLHNMRITPISIAGTEELQLDVTGKTYRYLDEESP
jgi:type IV pilus assembly protein PilO